MKLGPVDHITINVTDMKAAVDFFKKLGMQEEGSLDGGNIMFLWNGDEEHPLHIQLDLILEQVPDSRPSGPAGWSVQSAGMNHIAVTMPDLEEAAKEVKAAGIEALHEPFYQSLSGRTIFSFEGPGGVVLQFARKDGRGEYEDFK